jgi:short subunit dehydrogenase-like uncharacterized protein
MAGRIVLFGATGYTGRLAADALVERGAHPVLAARSRPKLEEMARELGGLDTLVADVEQPKTVRALVEPGDVLVSTVGPYLRYGQSALDAAVEGKAAAYIDCTGEPPFIRRVFEEAGPRAKRDGVALITASGYDYVPGNLAGALALREAGDAATRVEIGYFTTGPVSRGALSGGTSASAAGMLLEGSFGFHDGRIASERAATRVASFDVGGRDRQGVSVGGSEQFSLPRVHPTLREVDVYLGWFGPASRAVQGFALANSAMLRVPGVAPAMRGTVRRFARGSSGGPDAEARANTGSHIVGRASDDARRVLAEAHVTGVNGYTFTGRMLAWAATRALESGVEGAGALGPVEAFGLDALEAGCAECGLEGRVNHRTTG